MRRTRLLGILFTLLLLTPSLSLAQTRDEAIDSALSQQESTPAVILSPTYSTPPDYVAAKIKKDVLVGLYLSAGYDLNHLHYSEWSESQKLDEDFGQQNGFYANVGYNFPSFSETFCGKFYLEGYYRQYGNDIHYKGATFDAFGDTAPFDMNQKSTITRWGVKLGGRRDLSDVSDAFGYVDIGQRIWWRGEDEMINGVTNYKEIYKWMYVGGGMGINYRVLPKLSLGFDGEFWYAPSPKMEAELGDGGKFHLKQVWGVDLKLPAKYYIQKNVTFDVTPYYSYLNIQQSDPISLLGMPLVEPDSKTQEEGVLAGFTFTL